jgi:hypothetical protein
MKHITRPNSNEFQKTARELVVKEYNSRIGEEHHITVENVFVVWWSKVLQNWKALIATDNPEDRTYYEVTYDGQTRVAYVDTYVKINNASYADPLALVEWRSTGEGI